MHVKPLKSSLLDCLPHRNVISCTVIDHICLIRAPNASTIALVSDEELNEDFIMPGSI